MRLLAVGAYADDPESHPCQFGLAVAQAFGFERTARGVVLGVEIEYRALSSQIGKRQRLTVLGRGLEIGGHLPRLQLCHSVFRKRDYFLKGMNFPAIFMLPGRLFCGLIPLVGHFDLLVELLLRGVEPVQAGRTPDGRFGLDVFAAPDAHRQQAVARLHGVLELRSAVLAPDSVSCSHCRFVFGSRCKGTVCE